MMKEIFIPTECPICSTELEVVNDQLFCRNEFCPAKQSKQVEHYVKTMGILGFGPKTIEKLEISSIIELYELPLDGFIEAIGEKMGSKLHRELNLKTSVEFEKFLAAFGIPLIGKSASGKLATEINDIEDISEEVAERVGLGPKATENLLSWKEHIWDTGLNELSHYVNIKPQKTNNIVAGQAIKVVITGKLNDFKNRTEASKYLEQFGIQTSTSVSKNTDYVISEEGRQSSTSKKAEKLNIPIVTIDELVEIVTKS